MKNPNGPSREDKEVMQEMLEEQAELDHIKSHPYVKQLLVIANAADALESWLGVNVGDNADWPVHLTASEDSVQALTDLLNDLKQQLQPYRLSK